MNELEWINKLIIRFRIKPLERVTLLLASAAILGVVGLYVELEADDGDWTQFRTDHHCVLQSGEKAGWRCDDGKIHYPWRQQR